MTLLEEPQAALYSWIQKSGGWRKQVQVGDLILCVDVGGGTTDLSLIAVVERDGNLELHRVAVGEHILLGGDNMDLALAHVVARKLAQQGTQADPWQLRALTYACRSAKETLLSDPTTDAVPLVVPSRGSKLIGGSIRTELTRAELTQTILEGFFRKSTRPRPVSRARVGLTQLGLPYAQDAGITRHLAAFLGRRVAALDSLEGVQRTLPQGATFLHPTAVLFNGGVFKSTLLTQRVLDTLNSWLAAEGAARAPARRRGSRSRGRARRRVLRLREARPWRAHSRRHGACVLRRDRIGDAGRAGLEPPVQALCVAPFGMEEGSDAALPQEFGLVVGEPVQFRFFGSSVPHGRHAARLLVAGRAAGAGGNPGDAARRRAHRRRGRAREAACARDRSRHARTRGDPERYGRALEGRVRRARRRLSAMKRYTVGIDLGTSNTVVAYVEAGSDAIRVFDVEQLVGPARWRHSRCCRRCAITRRRASCRRTRCGCRGRPTRKRARPVRRRP